VQLRRLRNLVAVALMALSFGLAVAAPATAEDDSRKLKSKVSPTYPELAKKMNVTGTVKLQVTIGANGSVKGAKVVGGHPLLVDPAIEAVKKWKYEPGPQDTTEVVEFHFDETN